MNAFDNDPFFGKSMFGRDVMAGGFGGAMMPGGRRGSQGGHGGGRGDPFGDKMLNKPLTLKTITGSRQAA